MFGRLDFLDFIPGFDPNKEQVGAVRQFFGAGQPQRQQRPQMQGGGGDLQIGNMQNIPGSLAGPLGPNPYGDFREELPMWKKILLPNANIRGHADKRNAAIEWDTKNRLLKQEQEAARQAAIQQQQELERNIQNVMQSQNVDRATAESLINNAPLMDAFANNKEAYTLEPLQERHMPMLGQTGKNSNAQTVIDQKNRGLAVDEERNRIDWYKAQNPGSLVTVNNGDTTQGNRPIVNKPPAGYQRVWDPQENTYRDVPIPGSEQDLERQAAINKRAKNLHGTEMTIGNLINSYAVLKNNNAITAQNNTATENIGALYSRTPVGKLQDSVGGDFGNLDNITARNSIDGLSMNALMKMISMSDVSAKAMDSDAEMRAWLSAIKDDNYEAALTKLHVLDVSFGDGRALQNAFESGVIDQATYQYVTNRTQTDPFIADMAQRAHRYASLSNDVGQENMTPNEVTRKAEIDRVIEGMSDEELDRRIEELENLP